MCLHLQDNWKAEREKFRQHKGPIIGYKLVNVDGRSTYTEFQWKQGLNKSSRLRYKQPAELTIHDKHWMEVTKGFHFFLKKPEQCPMGLCRNNRSWWSSKCQYDSKCLCTGKEASADRLIRCHIDPKDVVAVGIWGRDRRYCLVATKATVVDDNVRR